MNPPRAMGWLVCLAPLLSGCITLQSPGQVQPPVPVTPSQTVPEPGWHTDLSVAGGVVRPMSSLLGRGQWGGPSLSVQGGALWQPELQPNEFAGGFIALEGRFMASRMQISSSASEETLTPAEARLLTTDSADFVADVSFRGGAVLKGDFFSFSPYGVAMLQGEWGPYFAYRHRVDGTGGFYNNADAPITPGIGGGVDLSFNYGHSWSLGASTELLFTLSSNQSYFQDSNKNGSTEHGAAAALQNTLVLKPHFDIGNYSLFGAFTVLMIPGGNSATAGVSYRF